MNIYINNRYLKNNNDDISKLLLDYNNEVESITNCIIEMKKVWNDNMSNTFFQKASIFEEDLSLVAKNIKTVNDYVNAYQNSYKKLNDIYLNKEIRIEWYLWIMINY